MTNSSYCEICGFPRRTHAPCIACNSQPGAGTPARDATDHDALRPPRAEDYPDLHGAFAALANGDYARMVGQCLQSAGLDNAVVSRHLGAACWAFMYDSAAIYVVLDPATKTLSVESPVVEVPATQRVALLRMLLKLTDGALGVARFCLRGNLVVLRYTRALENLSPPAFVEVVREVSVLADRYDDILALAFDTVRVGPRANLGRLATSFLGTPCPLPLLADRIHSRRQGRGSDAPTSRVVSSQLSPATSLAPVVGGHASANQSRRSERMDRQTDDQMVLDEVQELLKVSRATQLSGTIDVPRVLVHRSFVFYLWGRFGGDYPRVMGHLVHEVGRESLEPLPQQRRSILGRPQPLEGAYMKLLTSVPRELNSLARTGLRVDVQSPDPQFTRFRGATEAREHLSTFRAVLDEHRVPDTMSHYILLGAGYEFLLRTLVPDVLASKVRRELGEVALQSPGGASRGRLLVLFQEIGA